MLLRAAVRPDGAPSVVRTTSPTRPLAPQPPRQQTAGKGIPTLNPAFAFPFSPGFVTSGLELWQGLPCGRKYFRQRMWGTLAMLQAFLLDAQCWFSHLELDPDTGLVGTRKCRDAVC